MTKSLPDTASLTDDDLDRARYVWTMQRTTIIVFGITVLWVGLSFVVHNMLMFWIAAFVGLSSIACYVLTTRGFEMAGRLLWFASGWLAVVVASQLVHPDGEAEFLFMALLGGPFLTFSLERERNVLVTLVAIIAVSWFAFKVVGPGWLGPYMIEQELAKTFVAYASPLTAFAIVSVEMYFFSAITLGYNQRLRDSHEASLKASRAKSEFLATMSHEIRTPMNGVIGMVEILGASDLTADQRRILGTVRESSFSLLRIIEDILDMSRIEAGKMMLSAQPMESLPLFESVADSLRSYADAHNVVLSLRIDVALPRIMTADSGRLRQILVNLLGNAIKFSRRPLGGTPGHAWLNVSILPDGRMCLTISDDGIGIDTEFQKQLFTPFHQSEAVTTRRFGGSGLGLAIVHQLVTLMDGQISVLSLPQQGATFTVTLPVEGGLGRIERPDLMGRRVLVAIPCEGQANTIRVYAEACGALASVLSVKEAMQEAKTATDDPIFILPSGPALLAELGSDATALTPLGARRVMQITNVRTASQGLVGRSNYSLAADPVLLSEFWTGLGTLHAIGEKVSQLQVAAPVAVPDGRAKPTVRLRILVAEDNEINQMVIERQLEQLGHTAVIVSNGVAALALWTTQPFDVVLTDCHMPEMDGFALTTEIRRLEAERDLGNMPIIAITANALAGEVENCLAHGMDGYLSKPVRLVELEAALKFGGRISRKNERVANGSTRS